MSDEAVLNATDCAGCRNASFSPGDELFDPVLVRSLEQFASLRGVYTRVHCHGDSPRQYSVEVLLSPPHPYRGLVRFDGPALVDAADAVTAARRIAGEWLSPTGEL